MVLHLLQASEDDASRLGSALIRLRKEIRYCKICNNISTGEVCMICSNPGRESHILCVVEDIRDVIAIENTGQFKGLYHVLGGIISPIDGIGPDDLAIDALIRRLSTPGITEIILALSATMEGDTTSFFLFRKISQLHREDLRFSTIARGVSVGDDLEYADEVTLGRSILNRVPYENSLSR